jgi:hypothetical protein
MSSVNVGYKQSCDTNPVSQLFVVDEATSPRSRVERTEAGQSGPKPGRADRSRVEQDGTRRLVHYGFGLAFTGI